jgi:hypothetical protein
VNRIAPNEVVARSCLAIVLKKPSDARAYKYKGWGELYDDIFGGKEIEPYIISWHISSLETQPDSLNIYIEQALVCNH